MVSDPITSISIVKGNMKKRKKKEEESDTKESEPREDQGADNTRETHWG